MKLPPVRVDLQITALYALFGGLWILLTDTLLASLTTDTAALSRLQTYKGWLFVAVSALVIFLLLRRELALRKISEETMDESEKRHRWRLQETMDSMLEGAQIIGFDWRYKYVNNAAVAQSRYSREELLGRTMMEMYPGIENTEMFAALKRCMRNAARIEWKTNSSFRTARRTSST